ncbi:MAG: hypothetical protein CVU52_10455, partial [Deltaproteobacteria bacterium HGW-Deltaproteobacteria-10]
MSRFKSLFYYLSVCLGIIFLLSIRPALAGEKLYPAGSKLGTEIFVQLGHLDFHGLGSNALFSHNGKYLSTAGSSGAIKIWEVETGRELRTLLGHAVNLTALAFSHDDRYLLSGSVDKTIKLWDVSTGEEIWSIAGNKNYVSSLAFSPDDKIAASLDRDEVKLWNTKTGREIKSFKGNEHFGKDFIAFSSMIFSPDGKYLVSISSGGDIIAWEVSSGARIVQINRFELFNLVSPAFLGFSSEGKVIVAGMNEIHYVDLFAKKTEKILKSSVIDVSPDAKYVLSISANNKQLELSDLNTGKKVWDLPPPSKLGMTLFKASFSPDNKFVLLFGAGNILKLYDRTTGNELRSFKSEVKSPIGKVNFSKDGKYAVTMVLSTELPAIKLWNLHKASFDRDFEITKQTERLLRMYEEFEKTKDEEVFRKAEKISREIDYYSYDSGTRFRDKKNKKYYNVHASSSTANYTFDTLIFYEAPEGGQWGEALWDKKREINKISPHTEKITAYTLNDKHVLTGSIDKTIKLFEFPSGRHIRTFTGHLGEISGLTFSPDGKYILSASNDGTNRLWDTATGKEIAQFISFEDGEWIVITPEGYFNASPNGAKHLNVRVGNKVYGIDQFYTKFYRPELVQLSLAGKETPKGELITDIAAQKPAPDVQILSPVTNSLVDQDSVTLTLKITDSGGGIGSVNIYLNGSQVANDTRGIIIKGKAAANEKILSFTIPLLQGQNKIRAVAFNGENSMESNPALISVISKAVVRKPNLYALVIGINSYSNKSISLTYAVPDATAFAGTLQKIAAPLFEKVAIR